MGRIVIGVIVGFVLWSVLWVGAAALVKAVSPQSIPSGGRMDSVGLLALFIAFSVIISVVSGFVAAKLARAAAMKTAWLLGVVLLVTGIGIEITGWDTAPAWYHVVFLVLLVPGVLVGARPVAGKGA